MAPLTRPDCAICGEAIKRPTRSSCSHVFCRDCLVQHLETSALCPTCGTQLFPHPINPPPTAPTDQNPNASTLPQYMRPGASFGTLTIAPAIPANAATLRGPRVQHFRAEAVHARQGESQQGAPIKEEKVKEEGVKEEETKGVSVEEERVKEEGLKDEDIKKEESDDGEHWH